MNTMFQTDYTLWLQSFSTPLIDQFFLALSWLGYEQFLQAFLVFIIFGINVRYGFILCQGIIWTAAVVEVLKTIFHYPRPFMIDNRITLIGQELVQPSPLDSQGGRSFWAFLPVNTVDTARSVFTHYPQSWGIPSGHAAGAVVIWGSLMKWFRFWPVWGACILLLILIPLSRLYIGMHFIADLLAGYVVGLLVFAVIISYFFEHPKIKQWLFSGQPQNLFSQPSLWFACLLLLPGCAALFSSDVSNEKITLILGANFGFFGVWLKGVPTASPTLKDDAIRLVFGYLWLVVILIFDYFSDPLLQENFGSLGSGIQEIVLNALLIFIGIEGLTKLGFMQRPSVTTKGHPTGHSFEKTV